MSSEDYCPVCNKAKFSWAMKCLDCESEPQYNGWSERGEDE